MTLQTTQWTGLTAKEAAERLVSGGLNELPSQKKRGVFSIILNILKEPMLLLLLGCGILYLLLGEAKDAWMLLTFVLVVVGITFYQERKTERALEALKNIASPIARVIRDGIERKIPSRELVTDDIIFIREGDRVPADSAVLEETNLLVNESVLTGESSSVRKTVWNGYTGFIHPGGEDLPYVYSGTLVTQGRAVVKIIATGIFSEVGKIGRSLSSIKEEDTLLKKEITRIVRLFATAGILLCLFVLILYGIIHGNWLQGILSGLTLSMAILPEEFPVILVIFLTLGAWRMSKRKVLVRKTPAIETLGAATVLCADKTGTITENRMFLDGLWMRDRFYSMEQNQSDLLKEEHHEILEYAVLSSQKNPFDPMEKEIITKGQSLLSKELEKYKQWSVVREYPLSKELLSVAHVWKSPSQNDYIVAAKGAPEAIADLCHFDKSSLAHLSEVIHDMSQKGYRILGVAGVRGLKKDIAVKQHDYPFNFIGLMVFHDPVRKGIPEAVRESYSAGMRVVMITGDYAGTAQCVAKEIGLRNPELCITGSELNTLSQKELQEKIKTVNIFARVIPEQKLLIVNALKANGDIVAMTGDGVNDAPALKAAHIGIAMGERGTDVARETADLILLNDDFSSIVTATRMGRRIFDNLKKAMTYIVSVHIPIAGMSLFPLLFGYPAVLLPAHIAFLELIIDPSCSIIFETEEEEQDIMKKPPRRLRNPLFGRKSLYTSLLQGGGVLVLTILVFLIGIKFNLSESQTRTLTFITIVIANILLILTDLSQKYSIWQVIFKKNVSVRWIIALTILSLGIILSVPVLRDIFHFSGLYIYDFIILSIVASGILIWLRITKKILFVS